jgi:hypothetical protein
LYLDHPGCNVDLGAFAAFGLAMKPPDKPVDQPPGPRRGAIPTPKEIIETATPFVPGAAPKTSKSKAK